MRDRKYGGAGQEGKGGRSRQDTQDTLEWGLEVTWCSLHGHVETHACLVLSTGPGARDTERVSQARCHDHRAEPIEWEDCR